MDESAIESSVEVVIRLTKKELIRVLHVDDEVGFLKVAKKCLEMQGAFLVETVSSVDEALKRMKKKTFDVIVSDYQMPGKDGLEFLKELRDTKSNVPFIMFTGRGREEVAIRALNLGADQYLNKTGDPETVYGELAHSIRKSVKAKRDEERVRESEEKYRSLFENARDVTLTLDLKGKITSINKAAEEYGFKKEDIIGKNQLKFVPKKYWARLLKDLVQIAHGKTMEGKIEVITPKGKKTAEYNSNPIIINSRVVGVQAILKDVTERKRAEEELIRLSSAVKMTTDSVVISDLDTRIIDVNEATLRMYGADDEKDLLGKSSFDLIAPEDRERALAGTKEVLKKGYVKGREYSIITKDGGRLPVEMSVAIMKNADGKPVGFVGISRDITERKKAEEERAKLLHDYSERIKELRCLYRLSKLIEKPRVSLEEIIRGTANLLPPAWQYPDITCARVVFERREFRTKNFRETRWKQQADIKAHGKIVGGVEVYYQEEKPILDEGPFLEEERDLIEAIAERLGRIVERKKSEEELRSSEERLKILFEFAPDAYYLNDLRGTFVDGNKAAEKLTGYDRGELVGKSFLKLGLLHRSQIPKAVKLLAKNALGKPTGPDEFVLNRKDSTKVPVEIRTYPVKIEDQTLVLGIARDITERKEAESALKKSEEKYRSLVEVAPDGMITVNTKGVITSVNAAFLRLTGYPRDEIVGRHFTKLGTLRARDIPKYIKLMSSSLRGKTPPPFEYSYVRKDGTIGWGEAHVGLLKEGSKMIGFQVILRETTKRKQAERAIRESQQKFRQLFKGNPEAAVYVGPGFQVLDLNPRFQMLFGYSLAEIKGKHINDIVVPTHLRKEAVIFDRKAKEGYAYRDTVRKRKDGSLFEVSISAAPIIVEGQLRGYVGIYKDVSQLKKTEEKLEETLEKLRVVGGLTRHDVRNKLSAITGNVFIAKKKLLGDHEALNYLKDVESASRQMEDILDFARTYEMLGVEELAYVDVEKTVEKAVSLFSDLNGVDIVNNCRGLTVLADSLLRQLFYNFIDNSLKHGEKISRIRVYCKEIGKDTLEMVFEDDGVGIPKSEKEKVFKEGYGKGTGYGLYLIRRMCEVYGWTIRETGKQGKGARFTITVPRMSGRGKISYKLR